MMRTLGPVKSEFINQTNIYQLLKKTLYHEIMIYNDDDNSSNNETSGSR
jgi:hypothetical protein